MRASEGANLERAYLCGADLTGTNLNGANIKGANFKGANLEGADFTEVDFEEDNIDDSLFPELFNKHNLTIDQLSNIKSLYGAKNLNHELETLRKNRPELFEETDDHKWYRENFIQFKS
ncbi:Pentapeptide repeat family protein [Methanosarcina barkeri MS]|uniref:Pentapeptide repeat family protein n=1 Tax=Methanosarcina barkeri MS TaxID=1434108 RepID=A0A0E3QTF5_METBA|nr:pentapeptide repeat-containing protein [Methanosarcina barkeri]AKB54633.1 Pentapeptide repeat family protein [Methanosarcina barkeri MS]